MRTAALLLLLAHVALAAPSGRSASVPGLKPGDDGVKYVPGSQITVTTGETPNPQPWSSRTRPTTTSPAPGPPPVSSSRGLPVPASGSGSSVTSTLSTGGAGSRPSAPPKKASLFDDDDDLFSPLKSTTSRVSSSSGPVLSGLPAPEPKESLISQRMKMFSGGATPTPGPSSGGSRFNTTPSPKSRFPALSSSSSSPTHVPPRTGPLAFEAKGFGSSAVGYKFTEGDAQHVQKAAVEAALKFATLMAQDAESESHEALIRKYLPVMEGSIKELQKLERSLSTSPQQKQAKLARMTSYLTATVEFQVMKTTIDGLLGGLLTTSTTRLSASGLRKEFIKLQAAHADVDHQLLSHPSFASDLEQLEAFQGSQELEEPTSPTAFPTSPTARSGIDMAKLQSILKNLET